MSLVWLAHWIVCVLCYWPMITYDTQLKSALNSSELLFLTGWHNSCETDDKFSLLNSPVWVDFYQGVFSRYKNCLPSPVTTVLAKHPILLIGNLQIIPATKKGNINKWPSATFKQTKINILQWKSQETLACAVRSEDSRYELMAIVQ